jgi:site-specific DNA recombinase
VKRGEAGKGKSALYARYSTDKQNPRSCEDQLRIGRDSVVRRGRSVYDEYPDVATSGSHTVRAELQRLMAHAERGLFDEVVVDDLDRLSRDVGDFMDLVFVKLEGWGVRFFDVAANMGSDDPNARSMMVMKAAQAEMFREGVRHKTRRGQIGCAIRGFSTGKLPYGLHGVPSGPVDPTGRSKPPPMLVEPHAERAPVVERMGRLWVEGRSCRTIAQTLNGEGLPAPHDAGPRGRKGNKEGAGWSHTTVRAILKNSAAYAGEIVHFNKTKWVKSPKDKSKRIPRQNPPELWVERRFPAIISRELHEAIQARFAETKRKGRGRPYGSGSSDSWLLARLVRCTCTAGVRISSRKKKAGRSYARVRCAAVKDRGTCNARDVSELRLVTAFVAKLQQELSAPGLAQSFVAGFMERHAELRQEHEAVGGDVERQLADADRRVRIAEEMLAKQFERTGAWSESLSDRLAQAEADRAKARERVTAAKAAGRAEVPTLPPVEQIEAVLHDLAAVLGADKVKARTMLGPYVVGGRLALDTRSGTEARLTGALDLGGALKFVAGARTELATLGS